LGLNPDRADVIIPATKIFLTAMKHAEIEKIIVPQIGLSDGIIHVLYEEYKAKQVKK
jgi:exopolyphosphatase/guanosine-5'-triphosphate,3'-diphosphate pyrophosphatase